MARLFGTNGVRGVVNEDLTVEKALRLGKAIGSVFRGSIAVATDTRTSADMIRAAVVAGLASVGSSAIDLGVLPTPALQLYVRSREGVSGGVMITASHNPPEFNGVKCISADGTEASRAEEDRVEALFESDVPYAEREQVGTVSEAAGAAEEYVDAAVALVDAGSIRAAGLTVCLDCANGAACATSPLLLKKLGVRAVTLNCDPQGEFPGRLSEPSEENLGDLIALVKATGADLGVAHDGDADRCVFIDGGGRYVSGDKGLAIMASRIAGPSKGTVVTTVSTSSVVEDAVASAGGRVEYTAVGAPMVARRMIEIGAAFGGEENGGLIFPEMQHCRDGAMGVAKMLELVASEGPLASLVDALPAYHTEKRKIECPGADKEKILEALKGSFDGRIDETDGVKLIFEDGWVLARPSGTEPIFRVFSESRDASVAKSRADEYAAIVRGAAAGNRGQ
ncbi:MAG: phosphoglucosamine mutase [Candidatus Methanoplasma sp.]|jgi:phosphomannomutase/phosphoglucomutase|nr:phosphoglucosamine mutase [Candidatus Methanoplasma sp.]